MGLYIEKFSLDFRKDSKFYDFFEVERHMLGALQKIRRSFEDKFMMIIEKPLEKGASLPGLPFNPLMDLIGVKYLIFMVRLLEIFTFLSC